MWKRKKEQKGVDDFPVIYDKAQKLISEYERTRDSRILPEMKKIKPKLKEAAHAMAALITGKKDSGQLKAIPAMAYNQLGGLSLYLKEYSDAWNYYEKSRQLALESGIAKEVVQATNNLGSVALEQGDFEMALEQFEMAASYCNDLSTEDKWMHKQIERNIETVKSRLGK